MELMIYLRFFCAVSLLLLFSSCFNIAGGIYGIDRRAAQNLQSHGVSEKVIYEILTLERLPNTYFQKFAKFNCPYVRYLIARNPYIPKEIMNKLVNDWDWLVRCGLARNPSITINLINVLKTDSHCSVRGALVSNPMISDSVILELYKNHKVSLVDCLGNPNCPEIIKKDALKKDKNNLAWTIIDEVERQKQYSYFIKNKKGRWVYNINKKKKINLEELLKSN